MPFGPSPDFLNEEDAAKATTAERIRSIWPFLVTKVLEFERTLSPRQRANFDAEDACQELWLQLAVRDHKFDPERSQYVNYAGAIIDRELSGIRDRASTVEAPRNASCRLKEYRQQTAEGTISDRCRKTFADIDRLGTAGQSVDVLKRDPLNELGPEEAAAVSEASSNARDALLQSISRLSHIESRVLTNLWGLFGREPKNLFWIAWDMKKSREEVARIKDRAIAKIKQYLHETGHPALSELGLQGV